ncbi:MAG: ribonucleoside-diphosphate reductase [Neisseriaceae bacterium]|nr:MAG: ribonucleoside-diphosphate reductase [Neisseriaceae bacterium]
MKNEYRWLTDLSQQFLEAGYLTEGQSVDQRVDVIANTAEKILGKPGFAAKFKSYFQKGWFSLSTPIWSNFGTTRGMPISCFGSYLEDNMESILSTQAEVGMMTKHGGGTSGYFGNLRPRGAAIKNNGVSSGSVHFMQLFDNLIKVVSQGNTRRGQFAAYLPIDHDDILEFLNIKSDGALIQDLSFGVCISDQWMKEMIEGDAEKRKVWARVLEVRANVGYPYLFFTDNVNNNTVDCYKDKGMKITHSNLCVTGDQRVVTTRGLLTAKELYQEKGELQLFDNNQMVNASPMKLIEKNADVYKITLANGMSHTVTAYHKIMTSEYNAFHKENNLIKSCSDLKIGDRVAIQTNKGLFGSKNMPKEAFLLGLYQADGTQNKDFVMLDLWENDFDILNEIQESFDEIHYKYSCNKFETVNQYGNTGKYKDIPPAKFHNCVPSENGVLKKRLSSKTLKKSLNFKKGVIPCWIWEGDEETQWQYIRGLLYADGTVQMSSSKGNPIQVSYVSIDKEFLKQLQLIFANLGLQSSIHILREAGKTLLPDGKGGKKYYETKDCWRLIIGNKNDALTIEENTGFLSRKNCIVEDRKYRDNTKKYSKIESIEFIGKEDVYCCTVHNDQHLWVCNGFITHNCSEILEPDNEEESFVCDLASMNVLYFDEWKDTDAVEVITYLLDAVMTEFIEKAKKIPFMHRAVRFAERHRALGIGQLGWHSLLQSKMIAWESMEAKLLNVNVAMTIKEAAYAASAKMALEYGEPEVCKGYGRRNSVLLAIAPTKSSAFILGQVSEGIEPERTNVFIKDLQKGKYTIKNKYLEKLLEEKGHNTDKVWDDILKDSGSVQKLDILSDHEKMVFKTFSEISQKEIIIQAAQRQNHIDQGQSLNLMIHPKTPIKDVNALIIEAWKLGIKTLYYQHSVNAAQDFSRNLLACTNCEA